MHAAIVIPTYKQPVFLREALQSALNQRFGGSLAIIVVNDGCPFKETHDVASWYARWHPDKVFYIKKQNAGLSAARNTGIDFCLGMTYRPEVIYFLDSDNRIEPLLIQRMYDALASAPPHVGWAYPDIIKFGVSETSYPSGPYNWVEHLLHNICEAGSMVRTEVFAAGLKFDESMKSGFEDWDFWMRCLSRGLAGLHVPNSGFRYRERPESMLSDANRIGAQLKSELRQKHKTLYNTGLLKPYCEKYIAVVDDEFRVSLTEDFRSYDALEFDAFTDLMLRQYARAEITSVPRYVLFAAPGLLDILGRLRLTSGIVWNLMRQMKAGHAAGASISVERGAPVAIRSFEETTKRDEYDLLLVSARSLIVSAPHSILRDATGRIAVEGAIRYEILADEHYAPEDPSRRLGEATRDIILEKIQAANLATSSPGYIQRCRLSYWEKDNIAHDLLGARNVLPADYADKAKIALILPRCSVELDRIAANYARILCEDGFQVYVVVAGEQTEDWRSYDWFPSASAFVFFTTSRPGAADRSYMGAPISGLSEPDFRSALGLLMGMSTVVNFDVAEANPVMSGLKKNKIRTVCFRPGPPIGLLSSHTLAANLISGFENVYDEVVVDSSYFNRILHDAGVPAEKLRYVPNVGDIRTGAALPVATEPLHGSPDAVRVLFWDPLLTHETCDLVVRLHDDASDIGMDVQCRLNNEYRPIDVKTLSATAIEPGTFDNTPPGASQLNWADIFVVAEPNGYVPLAAFDAALRGCKCVIVDKHGMLSQDYDDPRFIFVEDAERSLFESIKAFTRDPERQAASTDRICLSSGLRLSTIREVVTGKI